MLAETFHLAKVISLRLESDWYQEERDKVEIVVLLIALEL
jgi:hypothetical protein